VAEGRVEAVRDENEAAVELRAVLPLLYDLGYSNDDIAPKVPVVFQEGRKGRKPEADFVVYAGPLRTPDTSLLVVEAKRPGEDPADAQKQGESYAFNLRAPFLLVCDGQELELWQLQPTSVSEKVFCCRIDDLASYIGRLERLISRDAAVAYARSLKNKSILEASADMGVYETAEIRRTARYASAIERTLKDASESEHSSTQILDAPQGALVVATSGMGKTHLSMSLLRDAITRRWADPSSRVAVHIPLIDVPDDQTIFTFAQERIEAHHPGFGARACRDWFRNSGAILICDSFDRLPGKRREAMARELRNIQRDFPKVQLFVFTRRSAKPQVALPLLRLQPLGAEDKKRFARAAGVPEWWSAPQFLNSALESPLLLRLALDYRAANGRDPGNLTQLFSRWLEETVHADSAPTRARARTEALMVLAGASLEHHLTTSIARTVLGEAGIDAAVLDELLEIGALTEEGLSLSFEHEALADHLRALQIASAPKDEALRLIETAPLESDSLFPVLLMSALGAGDRQAALWQRLLSVSLSTYLSVLRFRADLSEEFAGDDREAVARRYLGELLEGVEGPTVSFFPQIQTAIREIHTGRAADGLRIIGHASARQVMYALRPAEPGLPQVEIGVPEVEWGFQVVNLELAGFRIDSGRLLGATRLIAAVREVIKGRSLQGGLNWRRERLLGQLRYLAREHGFDFGEPASVARVVELLEPHVGQVVVEPRGMGKFLFDVDEVIEHARVLGGEGLTEVSRWWAFDDHLLSSGGYQEAELAQVLKELYSRATAVYCEIVEHSFAPLRGSMSFFNAQPVQWDLRVGSKLDVEFPHTQLEATWMPVPGTERPEPQVVFANEREDVRAHLNAAQAELQRLGRTRAPNVWANSRVLYGFDEQPFSASAFDGESPALALACDWIESDLQRLFDQAPANDR
jgi:hypothetical protein